MSQPETIVYESVIHCPQCGTERQETMPTDTCQIVYTCPTCQAVLQPKRGDCCVFCSYGSVRCPSMQGWTPNE